MGRGGGSASRAPARRAGRLILHHRERRANGISGSQVGGQQGPTWATPGHLQRLSVQVNATSGDFRRRWATVGMCFGSRRSPVRIRASRPICAGQGMCRSWRRSFARPRLEPSVSMLNTVDRKKCGHGEDSICFARAGVLRLEAAPGLLDDSGGARPRWLRIRRQEAPPQGQRPDQDANQDKQSGRLVYGAPNLYSPGQLLSSSLRSARIWHIWSQADESVCETFRSFSGSQFSGSQHDRWPL
jgi:hypothetical protein